MDCYDELKRKLLNKDIIIGVIGMGYVGLPLAMAAYKKGLKIVGFDIDEQKISMLKRAKNYIKHLNEKELQEMCHSDKFKATANFRELKNIDVIIICVPTPLTKQKEPDLRFVVSTTKTIAQNLRKGQMVILESTTYPGTVDEVMKPMLEQSGLKCGIDFFLAFSPEREDPGRKDFTTATIPKVVGGVDSQSTELAVKVYSIFIEKVVKVNGAKVAEASKLTENIFRAVNIALVNELKIIYDKMGIDIWEVLDAASTKPFGFMRFNPGPGWGGHCIPLDPFYLTWKAKEYGVTSNFIEHAGEINRKMPEYVIEKLTVALNEKEKSVKGSKILIIGVAYKKDIDDPRESPAFEILDLLLKFKAKVQYYDPFIPKLPKMREWPHLPELNSVNIEKENLSKYDGVLIITDHSTINYEKLRRSCPLIVDTRGVYKGHYKNIVKA
jgi:UDP-N-acetyl-D-glucosamine dehydrogenase